MYAIPVEEFKELVEQRADWCISIYMPTDHSRIESRKDTIHLKNILARVSKNLIENGMRKPDTQNLLSRAIALTHDNEFLRELKAGLALFIAPDYFKYYHSDEKFENYEMISDRFHLIPVLRAGEVDGDFYVLALSQKNVRLVRANKREVQELNVERLPLSLSESIEFSHPEKELQHHSFPRTGGSAGATTPFHGHGMDAINEKELLMQYFRRIDDGVRPLLHGEPLLIAGVDYMQAEYRQVNTYTSLWSKGIRGNPDEMTTKALHHKAWEIIASHFDEDRRVSRDKLIENIYTKRTSIDLNVIVPAAMHGQIETLFLVPEIQAWGMYDPSSLELTMHEEKSVNSDCVLDLAAAYTVYNGGKVYFLPVEDMPENAIAAAIFHYPLVDA